MTNESIVGRFVNIADSPETNLATFHLGPIGHDLIAYLQSDSGGGMTLRDSQNLTNVAAQFCLRLELEEERQVKNRSIALVGKVQSGKTTGIALTIAALADLGIRCFIVLTGTKITLTEQTQEDLSEMFQFELTDRDWRWRFIDTTNEEDQISANLEQFLGLPTGELPKWLLVITCIKEKARLKTLNAVLSTAAQSGHSLDGRFVLFDDEADQASPDVSPRNRPPSALNREIKKLRGNLGSHIYVPVTATPQALLVQPRGELDMRPDEAVLLEPGSNYVGGAVLFGEMKSDFVEDIPQEDLQLLATRSHIPPLSLQRALSTFLLTASLINLTGRHPRPISMLVHPSQTTDPHELIRDMITSLLQSWKLQSRSDDINGEEFFDIFKWSAVNLDKTSHERILQGGFDVDDDSVAAWIRSAIQIVETPDLQVRKVSGDDKFRRREWVQSTAWIFVGGEVLGRGFVVKGLTTTYMPRDTRPNAPYNMDTLQQRARFFGYKRHYLDVMRGWFSLVIAEKYEEYVAHEEFLWDFLVDQERRNVSLKDSRTVWQQSGSARGTRSAANRTRGRSAQVRTGWLKQEHLFDKELVSNLDFFSSWKKTAGSILDWTPQGFTRRDITYHTWEINVREFLVFLSQWKSISIDRAVFSVVTRRLKQYDQDAFVRIVDMDSKAVMGNERETPDGFRALDGLGPNAPPVNPWSRADFSRINELFSGTTGQADRNCWDHDPHIVMTAQVHGITPYLADRQQQGLVKVGALAIHHTDDLMNGVFGEAD